MMKKRVASWFGLQPPASAPAPAPANQPQGEADRKKQNRRSISSLSQLLSAKQEASVPAPAKQEADATKANPSGPSRMAVLADEIKENTQKLEAYMRANGVPDMGFGVNDPSDFPNLPEDIQRIRHEIAYASKELESLVRGPREGVRYQTWTVSVSCHCRCLANN